MRTPGDTGHGHVPSEVRATDLAASPERTRLESADPDGRSLEGGPGCGRDAEGGTPRGVCVLPGDFISRCTAVVLLLCFYSTLCIFLPTALGVRANPLVMPASSRPTRSLLFIYEYVRLVPPLIGALTPGVMLVLLGALPFLDQNPSRDPRTRVFALSLALIVGLAALTLSYLGWMGR
jgi:hypothetical protein